MAHKLFLTLKNEVLDELDLQTEDFITSSEMNVYFDDAIDFVESHLISLNLKDRYLQDDSYISLVASQQEYSLPSDIIDTKIRKLIYRETTNIYTMKDLTHEDGYAQEDAAVLYPTASDYYKYSVYKSTEDYKIRLYPTPQRTVSNAIRIIYFKDLNRYTSDAVYCDAPQVCYQYIKAYVRLKCYKKELHAYMDSAAAELEKIEQLMLGTLMSQIADPEVHRVDSDTTHYEESV